MWPFDYFNKKPKLLKLNVEGFLGSDPMKENTLMTEDFLNSKPENPEQTIDQAVAKVQAESQPVIGIIEGYANWTDTTMESLKDSRDILAERIKRDQEELRQIDKVIEGMGLMKDTIISEEPSFQTDTAPAKPSSRRKPHPVEMAT